jgi:hypothetical protein
VSSIYTAQLIFWPVLVQNLWLDGGAEMGLIGSGGDGQQTTKEGAFMTDMKIQYQISLDDLVKLGLRVQTLSKMAFRSRLVSWIVFGGIPFVGLAIVKGPLTHRLWLLSPLIAACASFFVLDLFARKKLLAMRLRKLYARMYGGSGPFLCEWELLEDVLRSQIRGTETRRQWTNLSAVNETGEAVELIFSSPDHTRIPRGAFSSDQQRVDWLNFARGKLNPAGKAIN